MKVYFKPTFIRQIKQLELSLQDEVVEKNRIIQRQEKITSN